jgi:tRNA(Ile)-lysidine synthase
MEPASAVTAALEALPAEARLLVAVSGGADSTALLRLVGERRPPGLPVIVGHLDHALRGEASREDARFVRALARELGLRSILGRTERLAPGASEAASRRVRYRFLAAAARRCGAGVVWTAHTLDDQAETVLDRLLRGTGVRGLRSILPERRLRRGSPVRLARPLLGVRRDSLRDWLRERGHAWREDESNRDPRFRRVRLRTELLPAIEDLRPGGLEALARIADRAREAWALVARETRRRARAIRVENGDVHLLREAIRSAPEAVRWPLLEEVLRRAGQRPGGLGEAAVREALRIAIGGTSGSRFERPGRVAFRVDRRSLTALRRRPASPRP